jgi:hypothetical protein
MRQLGNNNEPRAADRKHQMRQLHGRKYTTDAGGAFIARAGPGGKICLARWGRGCAQIYFKFLKPYLCCPNTSVRGSYQSGR